MNGTLVTRFGRLKYLALVWLLSAAQPALAIVILSKSIAPPFYDRGTLFHEQSSIKAVGVGIPLGTDYVLNSFRVVLMGLEGRPQATGHVFSNDGTETPVAELQTLNTAIVAPGHSLYDFNSPVPFVLEAGASYWLAISDGPPPGAYRWVKSHPGLPYPLDPPPDGIAHFLGYTFFDGIRGTWESSRTFNAFELHAAVVPEPTAIVLLTGAALGVLIQRRHCAV